MRRLDNIGHHEQSLSDDDEELLDQRDHPDEDGDESPPLLSPWIGELEVDIGSAEDPEDSTPPPHLLPAQPIGGVALSSSHEAAWDRDQEMEDNDVESFVEEDAEPEVIIYTYVLVFGWIWAMCLKTDQ